MTIVSRTLALNLRALTLRALSLTTLSLTALTLLAGQWHGPMARAAGGNAGSSAAIPTAIASASEPEVAPVAVRIDNPEGWVGQRMAVFIELRASGSFSGTASFDLPQLPGTTVLKIGSPVVSTQQLEGDSWFVQTHEFALFSQRTGVVRVPPFRVRYAKRDDFTGPVEETQAQCPGFEVTLKRPPGSESVPFLITTDSFEVTETWTPEPGPAEFGAIFKRTIVQTSQQVPGMALSPAPTTAEEGIRVYPGDIQTNDSLQRGEFKGERRETITYMLQRAGEVELPGITYVWWNPSKESLEQKILPAVRVVVAAKPVPDEPRADSPPQRTWLIGLAVIGVVLVVWQRHRILATIRWLSAWWNPPSRVATRALETACHRNDAAAANRAWMQWRALQPADYTPAPSLSEAVLALQRALFGRSPDTAWQGQTFLNVFRTANAHSVKSRHHTAALPQLNPLPSDDA